MSRGRTRARVVLGLLLAWTAPLAAVELFPLAELRPGLMGVGRTVFAGSRIEEFQVEILGVLDNVGPSQNLIIGRLTGGPLANTGVIAGMSGSPVYVGGRLVGAVAYGFPFSKETIAGITPIAEMLDAARPGAGASTRAASARWSLGPQPAQAAFDRDTLLAALRRPLLEVPFPGAASETRPSSLRPLELPLAFAGFEPGAFEWARGLFAGLGFAPVQAGGAARLPRAALPDLEPGSPVGISLVEGDLDVSVTGTVTYVDGARVYAFGHPFYNLGPTQFPLRKAYVFSVFPSLYQSFKISAPGESIGTLDQDRLTAVAGNLGALPRLIPVGVRVDTSRGQQREFAFRMVDDELLTPALAYSALLSVLQGSERAFGTSSLRVEARLQLEDGRQVRVDDLFTREQPAAQAAALAVVPLAQVMANPWERPRVARLDVRVSSSEELRSATLERLWLERGGPLKAGTSVPVALLLRGYRGQARVERVTLALPADAPPGQYSLVAGDAATFAALDQQDLRPGFAPRDLGQLLQALDRLRRNNRLYLRLRRPAAGAVVAGEPLPNLPPSVLSVLAGAEGGPTTPRLSQVTLWEHELALDLALSGARSLVFTVVR
jgi:hypothetical protein